MMYVSTDEHNGIMIRDHYDGQGNLAKHQIGSRGSIAQVYVSLMANKLLTLLRELL